MKKLLSLLLVGGLLSACATATQTPETTDPVSGDILTLSSEVSTKDLTDTLEGTSIVLNNDTVTITQPGTYLVSGSIADGSLIVLSDSEADIRLVFNNVSITNDDGPALIIEQADKVVITLVEGSVNTLIDGSTYDIANDDNYNAALYSKDDLTINGSGTLNVIGNMAHAISVKDDLKILGGILNLEAVGDGIKGRDSILITGGDITVNAQGDAIQATNDEDSSLGTILITGGALDLVAGLDGIQAQTQLEITGSTTRIDAGSRANSTESGKALKAGSVLWISGGSLVVESSTDDALHSNHTVLLTGGEVIARAGDDGIHADTLVQIENGTVTIAQSYEGIESTAITLTGGFISVTSSDDGINGSSGNDGSASSNPFGRPQGGGEMSDDGSVVTITGGTLILNANGDGLDSNGSITQSGGNVIVYGPTANNNGAIDYNGTYTFSGGFLLAIGSSGMAEAPSSVSQNTLLINTATISAGTWLALTDASGQAVVAFKTPKVISSIVFSSSHLATGTLNLVTIDPLSESVMEQVNVSVVSTLTSFSVTSGLTTSGSTGGSPRP